MTSISDRDILTLVAKKIDNLQTFVNLGKTCRKCQKIINELISCKQTQIETNYYKNFITVTCADVISILPEISDPSCRSKMYHGLEYITINNLMYLVREWQFGKVIRWGYPYRHNVREDFVQRFPYFSKKINTAGKLEEYFRTHTGFLKGILPISDDKVRVYADCWNQIIMARSRGILKPSILVSVIDDDITF